MRLVGFIKKKLCYDARSHERKVKQSFVLARKLHFQASLRELLVVRVYLRRAENMSRFYIPVINISVLERTDIITTVIVIHWLDTYNDSRVHFYKGIEKCIMHCYMHLIKFVSDRGLRV